MKVNARLMEYFKANLPAVVPVLETQFQDLGKQTGNWPFAEDAAIKDAFYPELQAALLGEKSAEDALNAAEGKVNRILARQ
jgi:ABC-type glycerol-3-phosphate transport system substrate-binding protein